MAFSEARTLASGAVNQRHAEEGHRPTKHRQCGRDLAQPQVGDYDGHRGERYSRVTALDAGSREKTYAVVA
jgi:hypothetical protein